MQEIEDECLAIKKMGFDHILLVTGESERKVGYGLLSSKPCL